MHTRNRRSLSLVTLLLTGASAWADNTAQTLPFSQNWTNAGLITVNDTWTNVPGIVGYRGDGLASGTDPQVITADGTTTPLHVLANQTNPNTASTGGLAEFAIANPTVAFQGSSTAKAPFLLLHLDTRGFSAITVSYVLRDIDGSVDNSVQPVALQFRVGSSGPFTNLAGGFVADASTGPSLAVLTTNVSQMLPVAADNQPLVQVRIITADAAGSDEWIGVDDLSVVGTALPPSGPSGVVTADPSSVDIGGQSLLTVAVTRGTSPSSTGLTVVADLSVLGGSASQALLDDGLNGDVTPGDDVFSFRVNVPLSTSPGAKTINVSITDAQTRSAAPSTTLTVRTPTNPTGAGDATPSSAAIGSQALLTVMVNPGTNPASTGLTVSGDLTLIGGSATQAFFDDGSNGDATAGDRLFSFRASIASGTTTGGKTMPVVVSDAQGRMGNTSIFMLVSYGAGPTGSGAANPSSTVAGDTTLLTMTVTPGNNPTSTGLTVIADLTGIGGGASIALLDDGTNGDVTAGDNVFSLRVTVAASTPSGNLTIPVVMSDAQSRTRSGSIDLMVLGSTSPTGSGLATPASVLAGAQTLLTVAVTAGTNPTSTGLVVSVDLSSMGGSASQALLDDGTGGDVTAADNTFSFDTTVPVTAMLGSRTLAVAISDAQARTGSTNISLTVSAAPTAPTASGGASPSMLPAGSSTLLTVTVTPGANPTSTAVAVSADLSAIGGSTTQAFLDDGALGDVSASDGVFSFSAVVATGSTLGAKSMPVVVADGQGRSAAATLELTVSPGPSSPVASGTATPASVVVGGTSSFEVTVSPGANPMSTGLTATIDLRSIGGGAAQALLDDGAGGDLSAGDGIFSFLGTVALSTPAGLKSLPVAVTDAQSRTATAAVALTVTPAPSNPSAVAAANPSTLAPGGTTLLTVTVAPGASPTSTGLSVTGNLMTVGGSTTQALRDDGMMGDVTAADGVFSFSAPVPAAAVPGARLLVFSVTDDQARTASASVQLVVSAPPPRCGNSVIEGDELCDDGNTNAGDCCSAMCTYEPADTVCRAAGGGCDVAETCTGNSARCPGDVKATGVCRPAAGVCDVEERCDGLSIACPADVFSSQVCRAAGGSCDVAESCDGSSATCPANASAPEEQTCGEDLVCRAGACAPVMAVAPPGCNCLAGPGSGSGALLGLLLLGLMATRRRRS